MFDYEMVVACSFKHPLPSPVQFLAFVSNTFFVPSLIDIWGGETLEHVSDHSDEFQREDQWSFFNYLWAITFDFYNKNELGKIQLNLVIMYDCGYNEKIYLNFFWVSICNFTVYNVNTSIVPCSSLWLNLILDL